MNSEEGSAQKREQVKRTENPSQAEADNSLSPSLSLCNNLGPPPKEEIKYLPGEGTKNLLQGQ